MTDLRRTALYDVHQAAGAKFTDFGGWDMPLRYSSELTEHKAVRTAAGIFDLSHMGEIWVTGPDAGTALNTGLASNLDAVSVGRAKYTMMLNDDGGVIDDLIAYRLATDRFLLVPNAGNAARVCQELRHRLEASVDEILDVSLDDATDRTALIAVQGPAAERILTAVAPEDASRIVQLRNYAAVEAIVSDQTVLIARTGYTGEDGFEIMLANEHAIWLWEALMTAGAEHGLIPCGLAARDSLRLEAGMPLYGNELTGHSTPFEAGAGGIVSFRKTEDFPGRTALEPYRKNGEAPGAQPAQKLIGLRGVQRRAARAGNVILLDGAPIGEVTSGQPSPTLGYPIAMGYIRTDALGPEQTLTEGTELSVDIRGKAHPFAVVALPFYTR